MANLKKLSDIKVGSIVKIGGNQYEVVKHHGTQLDVKRQGLTLRSGTLGVTGHNTLITVMYEPKAVQTTTSTQQALNAALANVKAAKKSSLTDSLKAQINTSGSVGAGYVRADYAQAVDGKARFDAQLAKVAAKQAHEQASSVADEVTDVNAVIDNLADAVDEIEDNLQDIGYDISRIESDVKGIKLNRNFDAQVVRGISQRVEKLEQRESDRMFQEQAQAKLNEKLGLQSQLNQKLAANKAQGGNKMTNLFGSFKGLFGKVEGQFAVAATGQIAMRNGLTENYVVYDQKTGAITDVQSLVLDFQVPAFRLPVEAKNIKAGNIVVNNGTYGYVTDVADDFVKVTFPTKNSQGTVLPTRNLIMAKPFYTVVQTLDIAGQNGFNPALLLAMGKGNKEDILPFLLMSGGLGGQAQAGGIDPTLLMLLGDNVDELLPFLLLQQGGATEGGFNPLMLLAMSGKGEKGGKKDLLPLLAMSGALGGQGQAAGGINPLMFLAMGDGEIDPTTLMLMSGGFGGANPFGTVAAPAPQAKNENEKK